MSAPKRKLSEDGHELSDNLPQKKQRSIDSNEDVYPQSPSSQDPTKTLFYSTGNNSIKPIPFQQPTPLTTFSYISIPSVSTSGSHPPASHDRKFEFGNASLKYFVPPPARAKLGYGYERWIRRPEEKGRLDSLLRAFKHAQERSGFDPNMISVVCWRGVMTKILTAPYTTQGDRDGPWEMNVMTVGQTMFFEEHLDEVKLRDKNAVDPKQRQNMYYGYAFESYCTAPPENSPRNPNHPPGWGGDVDTNEQWCSVVKTKLGDSRIVLGGEVDCVAGEYKGRLDQMIELKTSMRIRHDQDRMRFEKKLLKFYFQSFLLGVPRIIVGFRTPAGELSTTETFNTMDIPRMVRGKPGGWDPSVGLHWGNRLLDWLKDQCIRRTGSDDEGTSSVMKPVWRAKFTPGVGVELRRLSEEEIREEVAHDDAVEREGFLPKWYVSNVHRDTVGEPNVQSPGRNNGSASVPVRPMEGGGWKI